MRRAIVLLGLTTLVLAGWSGGAKTPPVVASGSAQRQAAEAYWTAERMKNAKPVPLLVKHGTPPNGGRIAQSTHYPFPYARYRWSGPTTDLPARTWGKSSLPPPTATTSARGLRCRARTGAWCGRRGTARPPPARRASTRTAGSSCPPTTTARRRSASLWPDISPLRTRGTQRGTRRSTSPRSWSRRSRARRSSTPSADGDRVQPDAHAGVRLRRLPGGLSLRRTDAVRVRRPARRQRPQRQPADDRHWLRHDRRLERRRLARQRIERPRDDRLGEQLRLLQPAGRDVRPVPGARRGAPVRPGVQLEVGIARAASKGTRDGTKPHEARAQAAHACAHQTEARTEAARPSAP